MAKPQNSAPDPYADALSGPKLITIAKKLTADEAYEVALELGFDTTLIEIIKADNPRVVIANNVMLTKWLQREGRKGKDQFIKLMQALDKIGRKDIADDYRRSFEEAAGTSNTSKSSALLTSASSSTKPALQQDSAAGRGEKPNALEAELLRYKAAKKQQQEEAGEGESGPASFTNFGRKKERALDVGYMMTVFKEVPYSVGMIMHEGTHKGTGFRVGRHYLMTCLHVVSGENGLKVKFNHISGMGLPEVIVDINEVVYSDEALDVAILKINGAEQLESRPLQLSKNAVDGPLCFFGHPGFGDNTPMMLDTGIEMICLADIEKDRVKIIEYFQTLLHYCNSHVDPHEVYRNCGMSFQRPTEVRFDGMLDDNFRIIHTAFLPGASGSPGVQVDGSGSVTVRLMLCRGFPAFYHELTDAGRALHPMPSQKFRFEHGLDMSRLYGKMDQWVSDGSENSPDRKQFLEEIFG